MRATLPYYYSIILIGFILGTSTVQAQQESQYTQYMYNTMSINPAYAGSRGSLSILALYRAQWVGLDGAPRTMNFSANSPIGVRGVGIGLSFISDEIGPSSQSQITADFSYTLQLNERGTRLAFGVKVGVNSMDINGKKLDWYNPNDPIYNFVIRHKMKPIIGTGLFMYDKNWYLGFSVPNLLSTRYYDDVKVSVYNSKAHFYLTGGYVFDISPNFKLKPAALIKATSGAPVSLDVTINALLMNKLTLGAAYRFDAAVSALAGFQISPNIMVGYAYDYSTTDLGHYNSGSHEIFLRFELGTRSQPKVNPRFF